MVKFPTFDRTSETAKVSFFESLLAERTVKSFHSFSDGLIINYLQTGRCSFSARLRLAKSLADYFQALPEFKVSTNFLTGLCGRILDCEPLQEWASTNGDDELFELSRLAVLNEHPIHCMDRLQSIRREFVCSMHRHDFTKAARTMLVLAKWDRNVVVQNATRQAFSQLSVYSSSLRFEDIDVELGYFQYVTRH